MSDQELTQEQDQISESKEEGEEDSNGGLESAEVTL